MRSKDYKGARVEILKGDIVDQHVDVIVNAANPHLAGGGGVDGAIHRAAGPTLPEACRAVIAERGQPLRHGDVALTEAGNLHAKFVAHAVGPIWQDGIHGEMIALERAYLRSLELGTEQGARSFAFPSISTGAYGFPVDRAAYVALMTIFRFIDENPGRVDTVRIVLFDDATYATFDTVFQKVVRTQLGSGHEG